VTASTEAGVARIDRFTSRTQADIACGLLRANGFEARVSGDDAGGVHPDIPFGIGGTAVIVPDEEFEDATALLDQHRLTPDDSGEADVSDGDFHRPGEPQATDESKPRLALRAVVLIVVVVMIVAAVVTAADAVFG